MKRIISIFSLLFIFLMNIYSSENGGTAGYFLTYGGSTARSIALGNAFSAIGNDSSVSYFNPANLSYLQFKEVSFLYFSPLKDVEYSNLNFALPFADYHILGFSKIDFKISSIEKIDSEGFLKGNFSDIYSAYIVSYAHKFNNLLSLGVNFKLITHSIDTYFANSFGMDVGSTFSFSNFYNLAIILQNIISPSLKLDSEEDIYPVNLRVGNGIFLFDKNLILSADLIFINILSNNKQFDGNGKMFIDYALGVEYTLLNILSIRAGINNTFPSLGIGITNENFTIDYASNFASFGIVNNFSITARFGMLPTAKEKKLMKEKQILTKEKEKVEFNKNYQEALKYFNENKFNKAFYKIQTLLKEYPTNKELLNLKEKIEISLRKEKAKNLFEKGLSLILKGKKEKGEKYLKDAENLDPEILRKKETEFLSNGNKYLNKAEYQKAKKFFIKVLAINPDNKEALEKLEKIESLLEMMK